MIQCIKMDSRPLSGILASSPGILDASTSYRKQEPEGSLRLASVVERDRVLKPPNVEDIPWVIIK